MGDNFKQKTISVVTWTAVDRIGQQIFQFIVGLILARLIAPEAFGLIAMLAVFNALSYVLVDSGFGQSIIRKKTSNPQELSTIFFLNVGIGVFLYILLYLSAPAIASFFQQPGLINIARVAFLSIVFNAFYLIPLNVLAIRLDIKSITKGNIAATLLSGTLGIILAFMNVGVWALVWQQVSYHFFEVIFFHLIVHWQPQFYFNKNYLSGHIKFSINLLGTGVLNVIFNNIFTLIIGKFFPIKELGFYYQASKQSETVNYTFVSILAGSTYNIFSHIQEQTERLSRILSEFFQKTALVIIPLQMFLIVCAENLIVTLIGEKWMPAVPYFQLLSAANIVAPLYALNINVLNARGKSRTTFIIEIIKKSMILLAIVAFFSISSKMMIAGYALAGWIAFLITMLAVKKELKRYWTVQVREILPAIGFGLVIGAITWLIGRMENNYYLLTGIQLVSAVILYVTLIRIFYKDIYFTTWKTVKKLIKKK